MSYLSKHAHVNVFFSFSYFSEMKPRAFDLVIDRLIIVQLAAFLEIAHVLLGWVKGGVLQTIIQVRISKFSRNVQHFSPKFPRVISRKKNQYFLSIFCPNTIRLNWPCWKTIKSGNLGKCFELFEIFPVGPYQLK